MIKEEIEYNSSTKASVNKKIEGKVSKEQK
jgi:hypothetical protein